MKKKFLNSFFAWLVILLQMVVGLAVMKAGFDLGTGKILLSSSDGGQGVTALFVIAIGAYFFFAGALRRLLNN